MLSFFVNQLNVKIVKWFNQQIVLEFIVSEEKFAKKIISALEESSDKPLDSKIEQRLALARENALKIAKNSRQPATQVQSNGTLVFLFHKKILAGLMFCLIMVAAITYSHIVHDEYGGFDASETLNAIEADYSDALQLPEDFGSEE